MLKGIVSILQRSTPFGKWFFRAQVGLRLHKRVIFISVPEKRINVWQEESSMGNDSIQRPTRFGFLSHLETALPNGSANGMLEDTNPTVFMTPSKVLVQKSTECYEGVMYIGYE